MKIAIIGGGAAGFFAAINIAKMCEEECKEAKITILEGGARPLAKVAITGGGRCNLTNSFEGGESLKKIYPRGEKIMRNCLKRFDHHQTIEWFESHGVKLVTQSDNCVFPESQDAYEIVDLFLRLTDELGIEILANERVERIDKFEDELGDRFRLTTRHRVEEFDIVVATTGGSPRIEGLSLYEGLELDIINPTPSLFSLNMAGDAIRELMGTVVEDVVVSLSGSKIAARGALLITHWGVSGPAILKLSSYAARILHEREYRGSIFINWLGERKQAKVAEWIDQSIEQHGKKLVTSVRPEGLTSRVWAHIMQRAEIAEQRRYAELGRKGINRLIAALTADEYQVTSRSTNKEEFVTCGGVALSNIDPTTMESRKHGGLYFAGEVLDIDAITGGYNLQAAWSTGYSVACAIGERLR